MHVCSGTPSVNATNESSPRVPCSPRSLFNQLIRPLEMPNEKRKRKMKEVDEDCAELQ